MCLALFRSQHFNYSTRTPFFYHPLALSLWSSNPSNYLITYLYLGVFRTCAFFSVTPLSTLASRGSLSSKQTSMRRWLDLWLWSYPSVFLEVACGINFPQFLLYFLPARMHTVVFKTQEQAKLASRWVSLSHQYWFLVGKVTVLPYFPSTFGSPRCCLFACLCEACTLTAIIPPVTAIRCIVTWLTGKVTAPISPSSGSRNWLPIGVPWSLAGYSRRCTGTTAEWYQLWAFCYPAWRST